VRGHDCIKVIAGSVAAWPLAARAQQTAMLMIGFAATDSSYVAAFRQGLADSGYTEGRNLAVGYRWTEGKYAPLLHRVCAVSDSVEAMRGVLGTPSLAGNGSHRVGPARG
jgi:putative tryptophan/tyrosine transport system substrate-binding protein